MEANTNDQWQRYMWDLAPEFTEEGGKRVYQDRIADYLKILKHGLKKESPVQTVAVIGAGVSGLLAARLLAEAGHKVAIYEANTAIGGRVKTIRAPFEHGQSGEAGAMRMPTSYQLLLHLIKEHGLKMHEFINHDTKGNNFIVVNGVKVRTKQYQDDPDILNWPMDDSEKGKTADRLWQEAIRSLIDTVNKDGIDGWIEVVKKYGHYSVYEFLKQEAKYSAGAIEFIEVLMNLESRSSLSLIQQVVEEIDHKSGTKYFGITGGMDLLPRSMAEKLTKLGVPIHLNHRLTSIEREVGGVKLRFAGTEQRSLQQRAGGGVWAVPNPDPVEADAVILTIPFPAMRFIDVQPPFSHEKRKAIRELNYDGATKVFLQFDNRFWETEDDIFGGQTITDLANRYIYYPSTDFGGKDGGVMISSYTWAREARGWDSLTDELRVQNSLDVVAQIHGEHIRDHFVVGTSQSWLVDVFSFGEAAMFDPGQIQGLKGYISEPEGNVYFAGDATSLKIAWIEGAIESGIRAALEVNGGSHSG